MVQQPTASTSQHKLDDDDVIHAGSASMHGEEDEDEDEDELDREQFLKRITEYQRLHATVQSSTTLLDSLSSFLSTFQSDLSAVSNQIYELQDQSKEIDSRLDARRSIAQPINHLISDIILPPDLIATIRDTGPGDGWLPAIATLHEKLLAVRAHGKVKAAHEIGMVVEGLKAKAVASLRTFLLGLIKPIRSSVRTNIQVIQSSILLKYHPFFLFLRTHAPKVAQEIQRSYVTSARTYYETSLRRYARAMGQIRSRTVEKPDLIGVISSTAGTQRSPEWRERLYDRLRYAKIEGDPVTLAYMADDKEFRQPVECLFRSLLIVLLDNASAEFTFIVRFFSPEPSAFSPLQHVSHSESMLSPPKRMKREHSSSSLTSFARNDDGEPPEGRERRRALERSSSSASVVAEPSKETLAQMEAIWKQVMGSGLDYCQTFFQNAIEPLAPPSAIPLLVMIRLNDEVLMEIDSRGCLPLVPVCTSLKLVMWPIFRKEMDAHVDSVKKLADAAGGTGLGAMLTKTVKDSVVREVCLRYASVFSCMTALSDEAEQAMLFSSMTRLRAELVRLVNNQGQKIKVASQKATFLCSLYEDLSEGLVSGPGKTTHPVLQAEIAFFRARADEARRRMQAQR